MKSIACFDEVFDKSVPYSVFDDGIRIIETEKVLGSVGKCKELNKDFIPPRRRDRGEIKRRERINDAVRRLAVFSPVEVWKYRESYYIVDGHRRVAAAKQNGIQFIDAHVTIYAHTGDMKWIDGITAKHRFEAETGIKTISLSDERRFTELLADIRFYTGDTIGTEQARDWKSKRFLSFCRAIEKSDLTALYKGLRSADIFALMVHFYSEYLEGIPRGIPADTVISTFISAACTGKRRKHRNLIGRMLYKMIIEKRGAGSKP